MLSNRRGSTGPAILLAILAVVVMAGFVGMFFAWPKYRIWQREQAGRAELAQAEWNRQIKVREAQAARDAAVMQAQADSIRAEGVAKANAIIGESLEGNPEYLHYLWIQGLNDGSSEVVYVPTEANLPILEAGRTFGSNP